jgi:hypothetical protein
MLRRAFSVNPRRIARRQGGRHKIGKALYHLTISCHYQTLKHTVDVVAGGAGSTPEKSHVDTIRILGRQASPGAGTRIHGGN